jgi:DNA-binding MarR family transcriptional regulator
MDTVTLLVGIAAGAVVALLGRLLLDRYRTRGTQAVSVVLPVARGPPPSGPAPPEPPTTLAGSPQLAPAARPDRPATVRASELVILHLYRAGRLNSYDLAAGTLTQAGMSAQLGMSQSALAKTLGRLQAAGVLTDQRQHVKGETRRLKVYVLTPVGEALARNLHRSSERRAGDATLAPRSTGVFAPARRD